MYNKSWYLWHVDVGIDRLSFVWTPQNSAVFLQSSVNLWIFLKIGNQKYVSLNFEQTMPKMRQFFLKKGQTPPLDLR